MAEMRHESMGTWTKISLSGKITYEMTPAMKRKAEELLAGMGENPVLVCDLKQVSFLDSSGIGFLVFLNNKVRQKGGHCYLHQSNDVVLKTLELVKLLTFFEFIDCESDLITRMPA